MQEARTWAEGFENLGKSCCGMFGRGEIGEMLRDNSEYSQSRGIRCSEGRSQVKFINNLAKGFNGGPRWRTRMEILDTVILTQAVASGSLLLLSNQL